jgi:pimeloyl-ACP methyl ester carboxylesterase
MQFALTHPERVRRLVVVDIAPRQYPDAHDDIFDGLRALDLAGVRSRREADEALARRIPDAGVRRFLLMNLVPAPTGGFRWKLHLEALHRNRPVLTQAVTGPARFTGRALFVRGERSDYVRDADWPAVQALFPEARLQTIPGAGHWVHADAPAAFLESVARFLEGD